MLSLRALSIWFPRLSAERISRRHRLVPEEAPLAVVASIRNRQTIVSATPAAERKGVFVGQTLHDGFATYPDLITYSHDEIADRTFLSCLRRRSENYSPWCADDQLSGLILNIAGCAHLFGGEPEMLELITHDFAVFGLTAQCAIADTVGAAWALARFADAPTSAPANSAVGDLEARATRVRSAGRRQSFRSRPEGTGTLTGSLQQTRIAPPGCTREAIAPLPVAALRIDEKPASEMARLGLNRIDDLIAIPRQSLVRRFGFEVLQRLDQALGIEPEPVNPSPTVPHFAVRMTFPDPIGLEDDIAAGLDRLLTPFCKKLNSSDMSVRRIRFELHRTDNTRQKIDAGFARPVNTEAQIRSILLLKFNDIDPGFGIDVLRLLALSVEPATATRHQGHLDALRDATAREENEGGLSDLIGRIGTRVGLDAITRLHPVESNIPEKTAAVLAAAWSDAHDCWSSPATPRPAFLMTPEPVNAPVRPTPPRLFRWRHRDFMRAHATGPERIIAEWWLDDPNWRTGTRDYWRVETHSGDRLWLFYAYGTDYANPGWYCHGCFA